MCRYGRPLSFNFLLLPNKKVQEKKQSIAHYNLIQLFQMKIHFSDLTLLPESLHPSQKNLQGVNNKYIRSTLYISVATAVGTQLLTINTSTTSIMRK